MNTRPITEEDLHGFVDMALDAARQAEVAGYLGAHPEVAARVEAYRRQRAGLREALAPVAEEPLPPGLNLTRLIEARQRPRGAFWRVAAMAVLMLGAGGASGWWLRGAMQPAARPMTTLAQQAADSYAVYVPDRQRPVELRAAQRAELVAWASSRLGRPVTAPDLSASGYRLMGGRLVSTPQGAAVLFMFDDDRGTRLVLLTRPMGLDRDMPMAREARGDVEAITWAAKGNGYSLVGPLPAERLHPLANEIRRQMQPT
ncbi:anti-sigma factor family protein [Roseomonas marmotae]|uniref:Anti-sigma factor n=1 Tax=Roseomonas marmotae TaxID=2768161 RepID=A0ABS3KG06_9PROT|nr:anti-sigma factor [Roseomonas marmotae]MBO1075845.1 anti-sigma factor [Roseomonas marmotae]QTI81963.1 anti-sigma factor [Roseomonas marmotae]